MTYKIKRRSIMTFVFVLLLLGGCKKAVIQEDNSKTDRVEPDAVSTDITDKELLGIVKDYVENSDFYAKGKIDYTLYSIERINEINDEGIVNAILLDSENIKISDEDIFITVGDTIEQDYVALLIDYKSLKVKGYLPTK